MIRCVMSCHFQQCSHQPIQTNTLITIMHLESFCFARMSLPLFLEIVNCLCRSERITYRILDIFLPRFLHGANHLFCRRIYRIKRFAKLGVDKLIVDKETRLNLGWINSPGNHHCCSCFVVLLLWSKRRSVRTVCQRNQKDIFCMIMRIFWGLTRCGNAKLPEAVFVFLQSFVQRQIQITT